MKYQTQKEFSAVNAFGLGMPTPRMPNILSANPI